MLSGMIAAIACFGLLFLSQISLFHFRKIDKQLRAFGLIWLGLLPVYCFLFYFFYFYVFQERADYLSGIIFFLDGFFIYLFLTHFYCQLYFQIARGVSIRIQIEIQESELKKLSLDDIKKIYSYDSLLESRLEPAISSGYLIIDNGQYILTQKAVKTTRVFKFLKDFFKLPLLN